MKKYVFLTRGIEGLSGNPRYVNNKCCWLEEHGWEVVVIWSYNVSKVNLRHIIRFDDKSYIFHELNFYPCWFTKQQRESIIKKILCRIGTAEQIVIESNKLQLGAWGEMIAERLNVKHINFVTTEHIKIHNRPTFDFCYAKLIRNEFFTINPSAVKHLFSNYTTLDHLENYYWSASQGVEIEEYDFASFDELPKADFTISHFGRTKGYFPYMLEELNHFISKHQEKSFNLFFLGDISNVEMIKETLPFSNVHVVYHKAVNVIPLQMFTKSDVIIATAGCASLASKYGGKVISMNVNKNKPLGLMRYTTLDSNTDSGKYENHLSLSEWLTTLLIEKKEFTKMENDWVSHSFDYQMQFVTRPDGCYHDSSNVREKITKNDHLWILLIKIGLFRLVDYLYFSNRNNHNKNSK